MYSLAASPRSSRIPPWCALPPAGSYPSTLSVIRNFFRNDPEEIESQLVARWKLQNAALCGSGKAALYRLLLALRTVAQRDTVLIASYTCPDVATAALRTGMRVVVLPTDPETLDFHAEAPNQRFDSGSSVLILSNLYGLPDQIERWKHQRDAGLIVIDDACQSALSEQVGARSGTFGVMSFGRGKAVSGVGGGAILFPAEEKNVYELVRVGFQEPSVSRIVKDLGLALGMGIATSPLLFAAVQRLPIFHVGETRVRLGFEDSVMTAGARAFARAALDHVEVAISSARERTEKWRELLKELPFVQPYVRRDYSAKQVVLNRYPLVAREAAQLNRVLTSQVCRQLGVTQSYPKLIQEYPELKNRVEVAGPFNENFVPCVFTLPVHQNVRLEHQLEIRDRLTEELG